MAKDIQPLAKRIKQLREAAGMSQQTLAVAAGMSISVVTQLEQGNRSDPRVSTAVALAGALGVTVDDLLAAKPTEEPAPTPKKSGKRRGD